MNAGEWSNSFTQFFFMVFQEANTPKKLEADIIQVSAV